MKKRFFSLFMSIIVLVNIIMPVCASATDGADKKSSVYIGNGYIVYYDIDNDWSNNQNITIKIKNTSSEPILNWALKYDAYGEINGLYNALVYDCDNTQYIIRNIGYNYEIKPNQTVDFGYCLTGDNLDIPEVFEICSQRTDKPEDEYNVSFNVINNWDSGFTGNITINNFSEEPIEAWRLNFDTNFTIEGYWNVELLSNNDNSYCMANDVSTTPIAPNSSKTFGFNASKDVETKPEITNCSVSGVVINENFDTLEVLETDLILTAFAEYNQEKNTIDIFWNTSINNGQFFIMESSDNKNYEKIVDNSNTGVYNYNVTEDFQEKYFVVAQITDDGRFAAAEPILIENNGNGYSVGFPDSDGDGISDYFEKYIGTDPDKEDTDDDGLTDYQEVYSIGTNPNLYDSVEKGVSDADADSDNDGLSNKKELDLGTNPVREDSDGDGLLDGEEVNIYGTEPLKEDTDEDGINDGDEIALGLDPLNPETFGIPDSKYTFENTLNADSELFDKINYEGSPFKISMDIKAAGNVFSNLEAKESDYSRVMTNDATLGMCPEFIYDENCKIEEAVIQFKISDEYISESDSEKSEDSEFYGIKKYNIFKYFEDTDTLLPVKTDVDIENNIISTTVDSLGSYCVIDMDKFFDSLDIYTDETSEEQSIVLKTLHRVNKSVPASNKETDNSDTSKTHLEEKDPVNVFFLLDDRNNMEKDKFNSVKENILSASEVILQKSDNAHIYVILCENAQYKNAYTVLEGNCEDGSFDDISDLTKELDLINLRKTYEYSNNCVLSDALEYVLNAYNKDIATYCFYIFNQENVLFRESTGRNYLDETKKSDFNISIISEIDECYIDGYALDLYKETNGIHIKKSDDFSDDILNHMYNSVPVFEPEDKTYNMVLSTGLKKVSLDAPITEDYMIKAIAEWRGVRTLSNKIYADTDKDGLYDFQEINFISGNIKFESGRIRLSTLRECINEKSILSYVDEKVFDRYFEQVEKNYPSLTKKQIEKKVYDKTYLLPILSDPTDTSGDTDGDGFVDYYEYKCNEKRTSSHPNTDLNINYLNGLKENVWEPRSDMAKLVSIGGFEYDPQQKIIQSRHYPIQRFFGFTRSIDMAADPILSSAIYCDPICFYYDGKEYMLELWKGQYGLMSGAEVGLYYRVPCEYTNDITLRKIIEIVKEAEKYVDVIGEDNANTIVQKLAEEIGANRLQEICDFLHCSQIELVTTIVNCAYSIEKICNTLGYSGPFDKILDSLTFKDDENCNYEPEHYYEEKWYRSVEEDDEIEVQFSFDVNENIDNGTDVTHFTRDTVTDDVINNDEREKEDKDSKHWWTTGFQWGKYTKLEDEILMDITINFKNAQMKEAFLNGGDYPEELNHASEESMHKNQKLGLDSYINNTKDYPNTLENPNNSISIKEQTDTSVTLNYHYYAFNAQPQTDNDKAEIQKNNRALLEAYHRAKEDAVISYEYDSTDKSERLRYTNDPNLLTVDNFMQAFEETEFFENEGRKEWIIHAAGENTYQILQNLLNGTHDNLANSIIDNVVSFSYGKEYYSTLFNIVQEAKSAIPNLGIGEDATLCDILFLAVNPGGNTGTLKDIASGLATRKFIYTDEEGNKTEKYLYELYKPWYNKFVDTYGINKYDNNSVFYYNINHFPGLVFATKFLLERVKQLQY
ncbi:MAG: DUF4474 domain-containing protein [Ruminococcus flavefaciens]|nr:DUF4474 domain-containing protein [Ruminococcus flavefaciens]